MVYSVKTIGVRWAIRGGLSLLCVGMLGALSARGQAVPVGLKVAAVQFRSSFDINDNVKRMIGTLDRLAAGQVQVAVFPECALTGYSVGPDQPTPATAIIAAEETLRQACRDKKIAVVFGSVYKVNGRAYDTAVVFNSRGELVERYGKMHLAGEKWAVPGNHIAYFDLVGIPSTVIICHDERYPEMIRLAALQGARIVYYISAESSVRQESKLAPYRAQMMARAVENSIYVVAANAPANDDLTGSHGQSRIINTDGNIVEEASIFGEETVISVLKVSPAKPAWASKVLNGPLGDWWRSGLDLVMQNRQKQLE
jgi:predicted amidohydrolase